MSECHFAECQYAELHYAECHYDHCFYAECRYADVMAPAQPLPLVQFFRKRRQCKRTLKTKNVQQYLYAPAFLLSRTVYRVKKAERLFFQFLDLLYINKQVISSLNFCLSYNRTIPQHPPPNETKMNRGYFLENILTFFPYSCL